MDVWLLASFGTLRVLWTHDLVRPTSTPPPHAHTPHTHTHTLYMMMRLEQMMMLAWLGAALIRSLGSCWSF